MASREPTMKFIVRNLRVADGNIREYVYYWCSGCDRAHSVPAERGNWNKRVEPQTLHPSVRPYYVHPETKVEITSCHYFLKNGVIEYCGDCPHDLNGQKVPL